MSALIKMPWIILLTFSTPALAQESEPPASVIAPPSAIPPVVTSAPVRQHCSNGCFSAIEAVIYASYLAPKGALAGDFEILVKAVGTQNGQVYFNSEEDYRDRNCLTIAMPLAIARMISGAQDYPGVEARMKGQRITVRGVAGRVRINMYDGGKPNGKFYFQVHVAVSNPRQVEIEPKS